MKTKIITIAIVSLFLGACSNTPNKNEIHESEELLLKENNIPIVLSESEVESKKESILNEDGLNSLSSINNLVIDKNEISANKIVFFDFNEYALSKKNIKIINFHVDLLKKNNTIKIIIEGHTDERGEKSYNLNLGEKRGNSVKDYMVSQGVKSEQVEVISLGETTPMIDESNEEAWKQNRRVVFIYN